jgi:Trk-type K+ transport system membrane component
MGATTVLMSILYKWLLITAKIVGRIEIMPILIALAHTREQNRSFISFTK